LISPNEYIHDFSVGQIDDIYRGDVQSALLRRAVKDSGNMMAHNKPGPTGRQGWQYVSTPTYGGNQNTRIEWLRLEEDSADYLIAWSYNIFYIADSTGEIQDSISLGWSGSIWDIDWVVVQDQIVVVNGNAQPVCIDVSDPENLTIANYAEFIWAMPKYTSSQPYTFEPRTAANSSKLGAGVVYGSASSVGVSIQITSSQGKYWKLDTDVGDAAQGRWMGVENQTKSEAFYGKMWFDSSYGTGDPIYEFRIDEIVWGDNPYTGSWANPDVVYVWIYDNIGLWTGDIDANSTTANLTGWKPSTVGLHEGRLIFANDQGDNYNQENFWFSASGRAGDLAETVLDDSAISLNPVERLGAIRWLYSSTRLFFGTDLNVYQFGQSGYITNYTVTAPVGKSVFASADIRPASYGNVLMFVQKNRKAIQGIVYQYDVEDFITLPITGMRSDVFEDTTIRQLLVIDEPVHAAFIVTDDGNCWVLHFDLKAERNFFINFYNGGDLIYLSALPSETGTTLWGFFRRRINGSLVNRLEKMTLTKNLITTFSDARMLDSWSEWEGASKAITGITKADPAVITITDGGSTYANGDLIRIVGGDMTEVAGNVYQLSDESGDTFHLNTPDGAMKINSSGYSVYTSGGTADEVVKTITGLSYLEGEGITVVYEETLEVNKTVESGEITLSKYTTEYYLGLPYTMYLQPFVTPIMFGFHKAIITILVSMYKSFGFKAGYSLSDAREVAWDQYFDPISEPASRFVEIGIESNRDYDPPLFIIQEKPYPFTPLGLLVEAE